MRDKWDEVHYANGSTYGTATLNEALDGFYRDGGKGYSPAKPQPRTLFSVNTEGGAQAAPTMTDGAGAPSILAVSTQREYYEDPGKDGFTETARRHALYGNRRTGFDALDAFGPFYPGLYVLGAASSLGKTTFALQLADQVAAQGRDVLYFSLEQSQFELFSKSVARTAYETWREKERPGARCRKPIDQMDKEDWAVSKGLLSAMSVRNGIAGDLGMEIAAHAYADGAGRKMHVVRSSFETTCEDVVNTVRAWTEAHGGGVPFVVVDYLQALKPTNVHQTPKDATDEALHMFKDFQDPDGTWLLISSLNRANYLYPVAFESFKETGGIEYTADVVWGIDLLALHVNPAFRDEGHVMQKREILKAAKQAYRREVVLTCLKNRYGLSSYEVPFLYRPKFDHFAPCSDAARDALEERYRNELKEAEERAADVRFRQNEARKERHKRIRTEEKERQKAEDARREAEAARKAAEKKSAEERAAAEAAQPHTRDEVRATLMRIAEMVNGRDVIAGILATEDATNVDELEPSQLERVYQRAVQYLSAKEDAAWEAMLNNGRG